MVGLEKYIREYVWILPVYLFISYGCLSDMARMDKQMNPDYLLYPLVPPFILFLIHVILFVYSIYKESACSMKVKLVHKKAKLPKRETSGSCGYDLSSCEAVTIPKRGLAVVNTGLIVIIPNGHYGRIAPRSGLTVKHSLDVGAGVIDISFRGEVKVVLFNHSDQDYCVKEGDRIAQLLLEKISMEMVFEVYHIDQTERGSNGFGSTGV